MLPSVDPKGRKGVGVKNLIVFFLSLVFSISSLANIDDESLNLPEGLEVMSVQLGKSHDEDEAIRFIKQMINYSICFVCQDEVY